MNGRMFMRTPSSISMLPADGLLMQRFPTNEDVVRAAHPARILISSAAEMLRMGDAGIGAFNARPSGRRAAWSIQSPRYE